MKIIKEKNVEDNIISGLKKLGNFPWISQLDGQIYFRSDNLVIVFIPGDPISKDIFDLINSVVEGLGFKWVCINISLHETLLEQDNYVYYNIFCSIVINTQVNGKEIPFSKDFIEKLKNNKRNFDFVSFNRNFTKPHRTFFVEEVVRRNLWDTSLISVHGCIEGLEDYTPSSIDHKYSTLVYKKSVDKFLRYEKDNIIYSDGRVLDDILQSVFYSVITESYINYEERCLTEKIFRFLACSPFILIGAQGMLEHLREEGFKTSSYMFDESYDNIEDDDERILFVMDEIERFSKLDYDTKMSKYLKSFDNILHNQEIFLKKNTQTYSELEFLLELVEMIE